MKKKISMAEITRHYTTFRCGYCDLHYIMTYHDPEFYNCGVYGWNCDIYTFGHIAITTGYRNMRGERIPDDIIAEYTENAKQITENTFRRPYSEIAAELENNRAAFIAAVIDWNNNK